MKDIHGGDVYGSRVYLDFSANLNPLGMPESVKKAAAAAVSECAAYPDHYCRELTNKLSEHEGVPVGNIVCGNGADDLIYRIVHTLRPRNAMIARPTFSEYAKALKEAGCKISEFAAEDIAGSFNGDVDMLILCNPNNPTGRLVGNEVLRNVCRKCGESSTVFLCDECFADLCCTTGNISAGAFMNENVIILKAFTKTYAMAGLRLGYAIFGSGELAGKVRESGQFWSVSIPAQAAGLAALDEVGYVVSARLLIADEKKYLYRGLRELGFTVFESDANYILFRCDIPLDDMLKDDGILIRNCSNYSGLGDGYFRIAVKTHSENEALIRAMERCAERWQKT